MDLLYVGFSHCDDTIGRQFYELMIVNCYWIYLQFCCTSWCLGYNEKHNTLGLFLFFFHAGIDFDEFLKMYKRLFIQCRTVISGDVSDLVNSHKVGGSGMGWGEGGKGGYVGYTDNICTWNCELFEQWQ